MNGGQFEWDRAKAKANRRKHGITFEEAASVFADPDAIVEYDARHSMVEDRWRLIGLSSRRRILAVVYTRRHEAFRIISARRASKAESRRYADAG